MLRVGSFRAKIQKYKDSISLSNDQAGVVASITKMETKILDLVLLLILPTVAFSATVTFPLNILTSTQYPDGVKKENTLLVNGQFPGPLISANVGDNLVIPVTNSLTEPTSMHWHGFIQNHTQFEDGPSWINQVSYGF